MDIFDDYSYAYIEFYVGMAKMVAYWHVKALGFELTGYRGPETGVADELSYLLEKNGIRFVITSAAKPSCFDVLSFIDRHGNGVKRICYQVSDVEKAYHAAIARGGVPILPPRQVKDENGYITEASIRLLDRKEIKFFNDDDFRGLFRPYYMPISIEGYTPDFDNGFEAIDHIAYGLHKNEMDYWYGYYQNIFGGEMLQQLLPGDLVTRYSGMLLKLLGSKNGKINNVFVEPDNRERPSQVQEYVDAYYGSGIQHMAFATSDIFTSIRAMANGGIDFVKFPKAYYTSLREQAKIPSDLIDELETCNVLCDVQEGAYLFQTFTKPFGDRPTFFYELIQRTNGYVGFALNNITELFQAVEREQERRISEGDTGA
jgi:4-hydroxyphenylpyruvate dioxygenase